MEPNITDLPPPLLISRMTYLPYKDVISLCGTNKRLHDICTSDNYSIYWKGIIEDTYGNTKYYQDMDKKNLKYDYVLYTQLINYLPPGVQSEIYRRQGDMENYQKAQENGLILNRLLERIVMAVNRNKVLDVSKMYDNFEGMKMISSPPSASRKK